MKTLLLRISVLTLLVLIISSVRAQKVEIKPSLRRQMAESAQQLFSRYYKGLNCDLSDSAQVNEFRRCFHDDATIFDDITPDTASIDLEGNFRFKSSSLGNFSTRPVDSLFRLNQRLYERNSLNRSDLRLSATISDARYNFSPMVNGAIEVVYVKVSDAVTNFGKQRFENRDTLRMVMRFSKVNKDGNWVYINPKISRIEQYYSVDPALVPINFARKRRKDDLPGNFAMVPRRRFVDCPGDRDCDGMPDAQDLCPNETGFDPDGCASKRIVNGLTISLSGIALGRTNVSALSQERLGFTNIKNYKQPVMDPRNNFGVKVGLEYDLWLGKFKNYGVGFGGFYTFTTGQFNTSGYELTSLVNDRGSGSQVQQTIRVGQSQENVFYNTLALPFFFKYSGKQRELRSFTYFVHAGAFLQLFTRGVSNGSVQDVDYEMNFGQLKGTSFSEGEEKRSWLISEDRLKKYETAGNTDEATSTAKYLERKQAAAFNVGVNEKRDGKKNTFGRVGGIGVILRVGGLQRLSRNTSLLVCGEIKGFNNPAKPSVDYSMTSDVTSRDFRSVLSATSSFSQWNFGISGAYQFKLNPKKSKTKE